VFAEIYTGGFGVECGVGNYLFLEERFFFSEFLILFFTLDLI